MRQTLQIADDVLSKLADNYLRAAIKSTTKAETAVSAPSKVREATSAATSVKPEAPPTVEPPQSPKAPKPQEGVLKQDKIENVKTPKAQLPPVAAPRPLLAKSPKTSKPPRAPQLAKPTQSPPGYRDPTAPTEQRQNAAQYFNMGKTSAWRRQGYDTAMKKLGLSLSTVETARNARLEQIYKGMTGRPYSRFVDSQSPEKVRDLLASLVRLDQQAPLSAKVMSGAGIVEHGHGIPANVPSGNLRRLAEGVDDVGFRYV